MKLLQKQLHDGRNEGETCVNDHEVEYVRLPEEIVVYGRHPEFDEVGNGIDVSIVFSVSSVQELFETLSLTGLNELKDITPARLLEVWTAGLAEIHTCINDRFAGLIFRNFMGELLAKEDVEGANWHKTAGISNDPYHLLWFTSTHLKEFKGKLVAA